MKSTDYRGFRRAHRRMIRAVRHHEAFALVRLAAELGLRDDDQQTAWEKAREIRAQRARAMV